jgi:hypothetical protein
MRALIIFFAASSLSAANLVLNPGFENWIDLGVRMPVLWMTSELTTPGSAETTTVFVHSGTYALQLIGSDTIAFASTMVARTGEKTYRYSGWARSPALVAGTFSLTWLDSRGAVTGSPVLIPVAFSKNYHQFSSRCTAPDSAAFALVTILALPQETLDVDDVALEPLTGIAEAPRALPIQLIAYPNPSSVRTGISFALGGVGDCPLDIYDSGGRLVRRLDFRSGSPVHWDGRDEQGNQPAAGIYFVKTASQNFEKITKVVLLP